MVTDTDEMRRLEIKRENERSPYNISLKKLASVMNPSKEKLLVKTGDDPLLNACATVAGELGIDIPSIPKEHLNTKDSFDTIMRFAGIREREVILKGEWWKKDNGPLLAFSEKDNAPLALISKSSSSYLCIDPVTGKRVKVDQKFSEGLKPFAHTFYRPFPAKPLSAFDLLRFSSFKQFWDLFSLISIGIIGALLGLLTPIVTGMIFDTVIPEASRSQMFQIGYILFTCAVANSIFQITRSFAALRMEGKADTYLQCAVMDRVLLLPPVFFRRFTSGDLAERTMGINAIRQTLSGVAITTMLSSLFSLVYFGLLFKYSPKLTLVAVVLTLISLSVTMLLSWLQVRHQRTLADIQGKISGMLLQLISGISKLRITGTENRAFIRWADAFSEQAAINYKSGTISNVMASFTTFFPALASITIFYFVTHTDSSEFSTGTFLAFNSAYGNFQSSLMQLSSTVMTIMSIIPLYERSKPILETVPEVDRTKQHPGKLNGDLEISHIHFRYDKDAPLVLKDVSMDIKAGQFVAIVGGSGSGKSTLLRLLLGFETQESGSVYYDGQDIQTLDVREVRRQIGVVLQNSQIMPGDIFRNIVGSSSFLTVDDAWEAAKMAGFEEDVKSMPMGMYTMIQAGGGALSGGQKQRLMIARAVVHKPRIIYFDEATSALDNQTQAIVTKSLEELKATRIVIAHRLSTIINADKIFVLEKGKIVQQGTYDKLMQEAGLFANLAKRQIM